MHDMREMRIPGKTISVGAAAQLTGLSAATVRRACASGSLLAYRAGTRGRFRIPQEALARWYKPAGDEEDTAA
jgi:excisionase family DNA binding protein